MKYVYLLIIFLMSASFSSPGECSVKKSCKSGERSPDTTTDTPTDFEEFCKRSGLVIAYIYAPNSGKHAATFNSKVSLSESDFNDFHTPRVIGMGYSIKSAEDDLISKIQGKTIYYHTPNDSLKEMRSVKVPAKISNEGEVFIAAESSEQVERTCDMSCISEYIDDRCSDEEMDSYDTIACYAESRLKSEDKCCESKYTPKFGAFIKKYLLLLYMEYNPFTGLWNATFNTTFGIGYEGYYATSRKPSLKIRGTGESVNKAITNLMNQVKGKDLVFFTRLKDRPTLMSVEVPGNMEY